MSIKNKIREVEKNPELMGIAAMLALFGLFMIYKAGVWIGGISFLLLNK